MIGARFGADVTVSQEKYSLTLMIPDFLSNAKVKLTFVVLS